MASERRTLSKPGLFRYEARMYKLVEDRQNKGTYIYKSYCLEVLVRETDWTIMHFQYMPRGIMIDITSGDRHLKITPYERLTEPEEPAYSRIMVWVEFSIPALKTEFAAEFFVGQLSSSGMIHMVSIRP
jgi:hypothetical protein